MIRASVAGTTGGVSRMMKSNFFLSKSMSSSVPDEPIISAGFGGILPEGRTCRFSTSVGWTVRLMTRLMKLSSSPAPRNSLMSLSKSTFWETGDLISLRFRGWKLKVPCCMPETTRMASTVWTARVLERFSLETSPMEKRMPPSRRTDFF